MTIVTNQIELQNAISSSETEIQIANNFEITFSMTINHTVSIRSTPNNVFTLLKSSSFLGAIFSVQNNAGLTLTNIILDGNKENHDVTNPGNDSLIVVSAGTLILGENSILQNNFSYTNGGAIAQYNASSLPILQLLMRDNAIIQNCTSRLFGGGIYSELRNIDSSMLIQDNVVIRGNQGNGGGGIYISPYVNSPTNISITGNVTLESNSSTRGGGALQLSGMGSELKTLNITGAVIQNNTVTGEGGGLYFSGSIINLNRVNFIGNTSRSGGGIYSNSSYGGISTIENCNFISNRTNEQTGYGGGIFISQNNPVNDFTLIITNTSFKDNGSSRYGGAIYTYNTQNTFTNIEMSDNTASYGGGIYYISGKRGYLNITDSKILNNKAIRDNTSTGGGIHFQHSSNTEINFELINTTIDNNESSGSGGGIYCSERGNGLVFQIEKSFITNNRSIQNSGGGLHLVLAGTSAVSCSDTEFANNTSGTTGGGIDFINQENGNQTLQFTDTTFSSNTAINDGGAMNSTSISLGSRVTILFTGCRLSSNSTSSGSGGGLACVGSKDTVSMIETSINNNKSERYGGGIFISEYNNGMLNIGQGVKITSNEVLNNYGGGLCTLNATVNISENAEIFKNKAMSGGGISVLDRATLNLLNGTIQENEATKNGGGLYNRSGTINVLGGTILENTAFIGGGIYNE